MGDSQYVLYERTKILIGSLEPCDVNAAIKCRVGGTPAQTCTWRSFFSGIVNFQP